MSDSETSYVFDLQLSDKETFLVGKIISHWGALEYEIFNQTLGSFMTSDDEPIALPKEMDNLRFTLILELWKERVVDTSESARADVLTKQYVDILKLQDYRNALAHGMWHWSTTDLKKLSVTRVRKKEINTTHFTAGGLEDFAIRLARINFLIRYPGGSEDIARERMTVGFYMSRRGLSLLTGSSLSSEWLSGAPLLPGESEST